MVKIKSLLDLGFFHIFGADIINKAIIFLTNVFIVRFLTQEEYGIFSYANSIYTIVLLFSGFGLLSGMLQFCSEKRSNYEKNAIYWYVLSKGLLIDILICIAVITICLIISLPIPESGWYLIILTPVILFDYAYQFLCIMFRSKKNNKSFARLQAINTVSYFIFACVGVYILSTNGIVLGRYLSYVLTLIVGYIIVRNSNYYSTKKNSLSKLLRRKIWSFSIPTQIASCINQITPLLNIFMLGLFLPSSNSSDIALYTVATLVPNGLLFLPRCFIVFAQPIFIEHNNNKEWFKRNALKFVILSCLLCFIISILLVLIAPNLITLIWGDDYAKATTSFRILSAGLAFSSIRTICTDLLFTLHAVNSNLVISAISLIINITLCPIIIPIFGMNGASMILLLISIVGALSTGILLIHKVSIMNTLKN